MISAGKRLWLSLELLTTIILAVVLTVRVVAQYFLSSKIEKSINGKIALVTHTGKGIGRELAIQLSLQHGCRVICVDNDLSSCLETVKNINSNTVDTNLTAKALACDLTNHNDILKLVQEVTEEYGGVDILIDNSAAGETEPSTGDGELHDIVHLVNFGLMSHFNILLAFLPGMISRRKGHIVSVSSSSEECQQYASSRAALIELMNAFSQEARQHSKHIHLTCAFTKQNNISVKTIAEGVIRGVRQNKDNIRIPNTFTEFKQNLKIKYLSSIFFIIHKFKEVRMWR